MCAAKLFVRSFALFLCGLSATAARADMVLNTLGDITWDLTAQSGGLGPISVVVSSNSAIPNENLMNAFSVGLRFVGQSGATGSIIVQSVSPPATERIFANYAVPPSLVFQDSVYSVSGDNAVFTNVAVPDSGLKLFDMQLAAQGANVSGSFLILADGPKSNYFITTEFDGLKFANIGSSDFVLGRLTITPVPEPSTSLLVVLACAGVCWRRRPR